MNKVFKELPVWIAFFFIILFFLFSLRVFKYDFYYTSFLHSTFKPSYNWFYHYMVKPVKKFKIDLINDKKNYFPKVKIYIDQSRLNKLTSDIPVSVKKWKNAKILFQKNDLIKNGSLRLRGDNPENWFINKSYRFKIKKNNSDSRQRYFDYIPYDVNLLTSAKMASDIGLFVPKFNLVELILNDETSGLYLEQEVLNENFLRRNKIMPVNLYKGENFNQDSVLGLGNNLYFNTELWEKDAYLNFNQKTNKKDLKAFLDIFHQSNYSLKNKKLFYDYLDDDYIAKFLAYVAISGDFHHSSFHNNRLILDPWSGKVYPVIIDPMFSTYADSFNHSSNDLMAFLNLDSKFINLKYEYINKYINFDNLIDQQIKFFNDNFTNIIKTLKRDNRVFLNLKDNFFETNLEKELNDHIFELKKNKERISKILEKNPDVSWHVSKNGFSINLINDSPIHSLKLIFGDSVPEWVFIDENYNGKYDNDEIKYFRKNNTINIEATLFANRIKFNKTLKNFGYNNNNIISSSTKFNFITSNNEVPKKILVKNRYLKDEINVELNNFIIGVRSHQHNKVIHGLISSTSNFNSSEEIMSGEILVKDDLIVEKPLKILPGTIFYLDEGANLIFRNKVTAIGTESEKIKFVNHKKGQKPWGTIALLGSKTKGSYFENIIISEGSGGAFNQFIFTSMFSIHDSLDITLKKITFKNNHNYDDMLHIVYSNNIFLENLKFENAFGDALDIDISNNVKISDSKFNNSKNDGIDLMESTAEIKNVEILNSGDKGVSIGEASNVEILESKLENNTIGIAVKDYSSSIITNSFFINNQNQLSAYKKNLEYGKGGKINVHKSFFNNEFNEIISENSEIKIFESIFNGSIKTIGENILLQ